MKSLMMLLFAYWAAIEHPELFPLLDKGHGKYGLIFIGLFVLVAVTELRGAVRRKIERSEERD